MGGPTPTPSSSSSWRTPSAADQAKYNLVPLPDDFEPTEEEKELLKMYETIRLYEREAARLKAEAAQDRLAAADAKFHQSREAEADDDDKKMAPKKKKKRAKRVKRNDEATKDEDEDEDDYDDEDEEAAESSDEEDQDADDPEALHRRREAKLAQMREKLQEAKQTAEAEREAAEEALRQEHLAAAEEDVAAEFSLKRKRTDETPAEKSSLIANLSNMATPPHDFSQKLGLKSYAGKVLFPTDKDVPSWSPPADATHPTDGSLVVELHDFDIARAQHGNGNNTLAIKFTAPPDSKRFSLNLATPDHQDFYNVLFHFNPRQHERGGQVVVNDKQEGIWGQGINIPLSQLPLIFGQTACTLVIQINGDGFDVFLEGEHCARLEHRRQLPSQPGSLVLQFPSTDDYGSPEVWSVYKVWWGHKAPMAKGDFSNVAGVNVYSSMHPRKLFVSGLTRISTDAEVDLRRAELERAFRKYGGDRGVTVIVPTNTTFAFVEMESDRQTDLALQEMQGQYRVNRARRSRHEALQEERAAAEAAKQGQVKENTEWD